MIRLLPAILLFGCGQFDPCEGVDDPLGSPGGLELRAQEHPGWGETTCFQCHSVVTFHRASCMVVEVDVEAINERVDVGDTESCVACHGANGVRAWEGGEDR